MYKNAFTWTDYYKISIPMCCCANCLKRTFWYEVCDECLKKKRSLHV